MFFKKQLRLSLLLLLLFPAFVQAQTSSAPDKIEIINGVKVYLHLVEKKETLYSLTKRYNITPEELYKLNPEVQESGLKAGYLVKIPFKAADVSPKNDGTKTVTPTPKASADTAKKKPNAPLLYTKKKKDQDSVARATAPDTATVKAKKAFNGEISVGLFLPLNYYSEFKTEEEGAQNSLLPATVAALEFYEGFKIAADSLAATSATRITLNVYDASGDTSRLIQNFKKPELKNLNLMVGPLSTSAAVSVASKFSKETHIPLVSPIINDEKLITDNPYQINCTPSVKAQIKRMSFFLIDSFPNTNLIVLHTNSAKETNLANLFKAALLNVSKQKNITPAFKMFNYSGKGINGLKEQLSTSAKNVIVIPSSEEAFVNPLLTSLKSLLSSYQITVVGLPTWEKFETIDPDVFQQLNTCVFNSFYVDEEEVAVKNFRKTFRETYKTEPSEYAYHGFDAGMYFLKAYVTFEGDFLESLPELKYQLLHTYFDFEKKSKGGYENQYIHVLRFQDFKVVKVNK